MDDWTPRTNGRGEEKREGEREGERGAKAEEALLKRSKELCYYT
jgi:hypothetical protein